MPLTVGSRLAHYDVTALIGEGGMGQVYQATDTKLNRQVALKILPEAFATDPDRLARFQREAQVLASLNHPGIAAIYGIEEQDNTRALVLELVEGPTLADRISKGPIPIDEALPIAKQIAEALEAAHEAGVIHRDLKPANIKVREDGTVKVLDFGLAKALDPSSTGDPSQSPTLTAAATQMGVIMGTAAYMSPEQARGKPVDKRTDIWAFGAVLFEMLTATKPFPGDDVSQTLARVIDRDPDWDVLPKTLAPALGTCLRRCLQKDPRQRVRDIGDVRLALEDAFETQGPRSGSVSVVTASSAPSWLLAIAPGLVGLLLGSLATGLIVRDFGQDRSLPVSYFAIPVSSGLDVVGLTGEQGGDVAISRDGRIVAYRARVDGNVVLRLHRLDARDGGADADFGRNPHTPFFSPDGRSVGYVEDGLLKRAALVGEPPITVCDPCGSGLFRGASWGDDGSIVFAKNLTGLWRVAASGGAPELLASPDPRRGEYDYRFPEVLPGGEAVLFTITFDDPPFERVQIGLRSLRTGEQKVVVTAGQHPRHSTTGHIVYLLGDQLWAVPFDSDRLEVTGEAQPLFSGVLMKPAGAVDFAVGEDSLLYVSGNWGAISHGQRNNSASFSDGFIQPRVCRGRSLSTCATRFRCRWLWTDKSVPLGKY